MCAPLIFFLLDGFAALISVPFWVIVGWWFGMNMDEALYIAQQLQLYIILGLVLFIGTYVLYRRRYSPKVTD